MLLHSTQKFSLIIQLIYLCYVLLNYSKLLLSKNNYIYTYVCKLFISKTLNKLQNNAWLFIARHYFFSLRLTINSHNIYIFIKDFYSFRNFLFTIYFFFFFRKTGILFSNQLCFKCRIKIEWILEMKIFTRQDFYK